MSYVLAFVGFAVLVILHEFGHFVAAKATGMRVEKFSLFFGPLLIKFRRGETVYGIGPIPLGGYVKITGMNPHEEIPPEVAHRAYYRQPVWKRIVVILAGPAVNLLLAFFILFGIFVVNGKAEQTKVVAAEQLKPPASKAFHPGDRLVSIDGVTGSIEALRAQINRHACKPPVVKGCIAATPAKVVVERAGHLKHFSLKPIYDATEKRVLLGFAFGQRTIDLGPLDSASLSVTTMSDLTTRTLSVFAHIFQPKERKKLSSVVGGYKVTERRFATSTTLAFYTLALISLSLAIINLFPFLPLDGGHVFWALAEKVRGKPISYSVLERASVVGFALVLMVFVIGLSNDIGHIQNGDFNRLR